MRPLQIPFYFYCGEGGIRTRGTLLAHTRFPGVPLQPLEHLSYYFSDAKSIKIFLTKANFSTNGHIQIGSKFFFIHILTQ